MAERAKKEGTPDVELFYGTGGMGKTYAMRALVELRLSEKPPLILDRSYDFITREGDPIVRMRGGKIALARSESELERGVRELEKGNINALAYHLPRKRFDPERKRRSLRYSREEVIANRMADYALDIGGRFITTEAHRAAPNTGVMLTEPLDELAGAGRHYEGGAGWWGDTQSPALLHTRVKKQANVVRVFGITSSIDLRSLQDDYNRDVVAAIEECARRKKHRNEPGWHVELTLPVVPPYKLARYEIHRGKLHKREEDFGTDYCPTCRKPY